MWKSIEDDSYINIINKNWFIYGNIEPDLLLTTNKIPHKREEALNYIVEKIEQLIEVSVDTKKDINTFSLHLGVICHYLSDFYCKPHVERWGDYKGLKRAKKGIEHILYEFKISFYKNEIKKATNENLQDIYNVYDFLLESFKNYQKDLNEKKDVYYASYICNSIVSFILENQIHLYNENKKDIV